jgi:hypothetical protein
VQDAVGRGFSPLALVDIEQYEESEEEELLRRQLILLELEERDVEGLLDLSPSSIAEESQGTRDSTGRTGR